MTESSLDDLKGVLGIRLDDALCWLGVHSELNVLQDCPFKDSSDIRRERN
jgi:hypothetical protein